jgi:hypothetical protein
MFAKVAKIYTPIQQLKLENLGVQRAQNAEKVAQVQGEISDLAFHNYRTYADVGRMADQCNDTVNILAGFQ